MVGLESGSLSKIHLAFYMHDLSGGGVERMRLALIQQLSALGAEVSLIVNRLEGPLCAQLPRNLRVLELGTDRTSRSIKPLMHALRRLRPTALISSLDHNNIAAILAVRRGAPGTSLIICQHNALSSERLMGWKYRAVPMLYRLLQASADGIVAVSNGVAEDLARTAHIPRARITTIYNPVVTDTHARRASEPVDHPWLTHKDRPVFLFVARLNAQKDPLLAMEAFARLLDSTPARLIILGDGPLRGQMQGMASSRAIAGSVAFVGFQVNPLPWMRAADALILTSRFEGLGNVLIEALACGTPVISTDCPFGPREILAGGKYGQLVPVGDAAEMAGAMKRLLQVETDRALLARRAQDFSARACAEQHLALVRRIASRRAAPARVGGLSLSELTPHEIAEKILAGCPPSELSLCITPNTQHLRLLSQPAFAEACRDATLACPDGLPVWLLAKARGSRLRSRVTGCDIVHHVFASPSVARHRVFLVLESIETANAFRAWARRNNLPGMFSLAVAPRNFSSDGEAQQVLAEAIKAARPSLLLMTLGSPVSELFLHRFKSELPACWALCIGQAVRVEIGLVKRAPHSWRRLGLEWLWRLGLEPARLAPRYAQALLFLLAEGVRRLAGAKGRGSLAE